MSQFIKPYNDDPFVGNLATPVSTSSFTRVFIRQSYPRTDQVYLLFLEVLEIGMTHGYFLVGPFYKLGPLRNSDVALLSGYLLFFRTCDYHVSLSCNLWSCIF